MEQVILILIAAVFGIIKWMSSNQTFSGSDSDQSEPVFRPRQLGPRQSQPTESEEERMRKFMEALGVPASSVPPPQVQRRIQQRVPTPQVAGNRPTPSRLVVPQVPQIKPALASPLIPETKPPAKFEFTEPPKRPAMVEQAAAAPAAGARIDLASLPALLQKPESLRAAFVLKEILGTPRGLDTTWGR